MRTIVLCAAWVLCLSVIAADHKEPEAKIGAEALWADLVSSNQRFMRGETKTREFVNKRKELTAGQNPKVIVLACADSRVAPELVFDKNLGELFVIRTAGNIADRVALGSIEYAAEHLHCELLVVLGHEKCGAVAAAASGEKMPTKNLKAIVERIEPVLKESRKEGLSGDALAAEGVKRNVHRSAADLLKESPILNEKVESGALKIIHAVYRLESGEVVRLSGKTGE